MGRKVIIPGDYEPLRINSGGSYQVEGAATLYNILDKWLSPSDNVQRKDRQSTSYLFGRYPNPKINFETYQNRIINRKSPDNLFINLVWEYEYDIDSYIYGAGSELTDEEWYSGGRDITTLTQDRYLSGHGSELLSGYGILHDRSPFTDVEIQLSKPSQLKTVTLQDGSSYSYAIDFADRMKYALPSSSFEGTKRKKYLYLLLLEPNIDSSKFSFTKSKNWSQVTYGVYATYDSQWFEQSINFHFDYAISRFSARLLCLTSTESKPYEAQSGSDPDKYVARNFNFSKKTVTKQSSYVYSYNDPSGPSHFHSANYEMILSPIKSPQYQYIESHDYTDFTLFHHTDTPYLDAYSDINPKPRYGLAKITLKGFDKEKPIMCFGSLSNDGNLQSYHWIMHAMYSEWCRSQIDYWAKHNFLEADKASPTTWFRFYTLAGYDEYGDPLPWYEGQLLNTWGGENAYWRVRQADRTGLPGEEYEPWSNPRYIPGYSPDIVDINKKLYPYHRYELISWDQSFLDLYYDPDTRRYNGSPFSLDDPDAWKRDASIYNNQQISSIYRYRWRNSPTGSYEVSKFSGYYNGLFDYGSSGLDGIDSPLNPEMRYFPYEFQGTLNPKFYPFYDFSLTNNCYASGYWTTAPTQNPNYASFTPLYLMESSTTKEFVKFFPPEWWLTDGQLKLYRKTYEEDGVKVPEVEYYFQDDVLVSRDSGWVGPGSGGIDENGDPYVLFWIYPGQTEFRASFVQFDFEDPASSDVGWRIGTIGM